MSLMGVRDYAKHAGVAPSTVSKQIAKGVIPVAARDGRGNPLIDPAAADQARRDNLNTLMRRQPAASATIDSTATAASHQETVTTLALDVPDAVIDAEQSSQPAPDERRSSGAGQNSGLVAEQVLERQLRNRRLFRENEQAEGRLVLRHVVDAEQTTLARAYRDKTTAKVIGAAGELYGYVSQPRTEGELRAWLERKMAQIHDEVGRDIAADMRDEFEDDTSDVSDVEDDADAFAESVP